MDLQTPERIEVLPSLPRLERLDHLRGIAALLVLIWHGDTLRTGRVYPYVSLLGEGYTGVSLFCTRRGFILAYLYYDRKITYRDFIGRRLTRILPLFVFYLASTFYLTNQPIQDLVEIISTLAKYGQKFPPTISQGWTILVEIQFYAIFPFLMIFAHRKGLSYLVSLLFFSIAFKFCVLITTQSVQALSYWTIFGRIDQFLSGMIFGMVMRGGISSSAWWRACLPAGLAASATIFGSYFWFHLQGGLLAPAGGVWSPDRIWWAFSPALEGICYGAIALGYVTRPHHSLTWAGRLVSRFLSHIGRISYSIYLNQFFVGSVLGVTLTPIVVSHFHFKVWEQGLLYVIVFYFPCVALASTVTYFLIERPFMDMRRIKSSAEFASERS